MSDPGKRLQTMCVPHIEVIKNVGPKGISGNRVGGLIRSRSPFSTTIDLSINSREQYMYACRFCTNGWAIQFPKRRTHLFNEFQSV